MNNPVLIRELRLLLRDTRLLQRLFCGWMVLAAAMLLLWPEAGLFSSADQNSRLVFKIFAFGQLALLLLLSPSVTAPLITEEKEKERFGMLFASLLTPWDILMGKWFSSFFVLLLVLASGIPLLLLTLALGGVSLVEIVQVYLIFVLTITEFGFLGLLFSCLKRRTYNSLMSSYAWMLVLVALTWLPSYLLGNIPVLATCFTLLRSLSPFSAMMDVISPEYLLVLGRLPDDWKIFELWSPDLICFFLASSGLSLIFFLVCYKRIRTLPLGADVTSEVKESDARKKKFPYYLFNPDRRRSAFSVSRLIFTKELRCKLYGYLGNLIRGIYIGLFVSILLVMLVCLNVKTLSLDEARVIAVLFQMVVILLMTPALTASTVAEEFVTGTMEMLRLTPLTSWKFFMGKFWAGILYMAILLASSCPVYFFFLFMEIKLDGNPWLVLEIVAVQSAFLVLCATCGLWSSALTLNTQKATGLAYTVLFLLVGTPFVLHSFLSEGGVLELGLSASPFVVCIRQASLLSYREFDIFALHFVWVGLLTVLMAGHAMLRVRGLMRQAR